MATEHENGVRGRTRDKRSENVARARRYLQGESLAGAEVADLARRLGAAGRFNYARRVAAKALQAPEDAAVRAKLVAQYARGCSADHNLRGQYILTRAMTLLEEVTELATTTDAELLSIAGRLQQRLWELEAQKDHVVRALGYFLRAYEHSRGRRQGEAGVHAAFLLDVLTHTESREVNKAGAHMERAATGDQARQIRSHLVETLPALLHGKRQRRLARDWRFHVTVAEAFFGLKRYDEAARWLEQAAGLRASGQQVEAAARHLAMLARLQGEASETTPLEQGPAWRCLHALLGNDSDVLPASVMGKIGLALSGGGFRAALFHVGVLARLAELDVLRGVEVISCVSGGSIVGAHYYLEVRKLLQEKRDAEITREDYIAIVQRLERDLLAGIQKNIRMHVAADALALLRVLFDRDYSRTVRAGELYEREIYARVDDDKERRLRLLKIVPLGSSPRFHPRHDNWKRRAKVPSLIINATTLNTGHNWQFTTTWMGEPPSGIPREVDSNERLRRLYWHQAPAPHADISIGKAVTASACVPGLFEPVTLSGLYPARTVRLVDGGVHDNQGIGGILDEHCKIVLVSDASGQMETLREPDTNFYTVLARSDNIARVHIRAAEYDGLVTRRRTALLHNLMFLHLKKDLDVKPVNWIGAEEPTETPVAPGGDGRAFYGIPKKLQERLAAIRTDLDSFCDQEAYALMLSGYLMTKHEFPRRIEGFAKDAPSLDWRFRALEPALVEKAEPHHGELQRVLDVARFVSFKIWRMAPGLLAACLLLAGIAPAGLWLWARDNGFLAGELPPAAVVVAFGLCYVSVRLVLRSERCLPTPVPELLGFALYVSMLLVIVEILWYTRLLWLDWTGFAIGTGPTSWVIAVLSAFSGLVAILVVFFLSVYLVTLLLRNGKSWSEVTLNLGFLFFLPLANLHLLTYDRWYLWRGRVPAAHSEVETPVRGSPAR
jgi:predicted acylesterase/phospholipase RssA